MADYKRKKNNNYRQSPGRTSGKSTRKPAGKQARKPAKKRSGFQKWMNKNTSGVCIAVIALVVVILGALIAMVAMTLSYDKVYDGIYLNGDPVSYLSKDELHAYIEEKYSKPINDIVIHVTDGTQDWNLDASNLDITFNIDNIVDTIYGYGHTGNMFQRLGDIYTTRTTGIHINIFEEGGVNGLPLVSYDESIIDGLAEEISEYAATEPVQHQVQATNDSVSITAGSVGYTYDFDTIKSTLLAAVNEFVSYDLDIRTIAIVTAPEDVDVNSLLQQVNIAPVNAAYKKVNAKEVSISPSKEGLSVTQADLEAVIAQLADNPGMEFAIPAAKVAPEVRTEDLSMPTYPDVLGEGSTKFGTSSSYANRNTNLRIATETLDGYILLPGEQFSFNDYVGDTTKDKGYLPAAGYANGTVTQTYGGGICQVSTTLYNAVINSVNIEVDRRSNHSSTVSYVPKGLDCMINYGTSDFKFTNKTNYPVKIQGIYDSKGTLTYRIIGINEHKDISYKFISTQTKSTQPSTKYTTNPAEVQSGQAGGTWKVERVTYQNGVEIKREQFSTSTYKAMDRIILKTAATPTPAPTSTPAPTPSTTDSTDNE